MSARKTRLRNKQRRPLPFMLSFWFKPPGGEWQQHSEVRSQRIPKPGFIRVGATMFVYAPRLERSEA